MKVYSVDTFAKPFGTKFRYYAQLDCKRSDEHFLDDENFEGHPFPKKWRRVELHFSEPLWPRADFYNFGLGNFVCTERAKSIVGPLLSKVGEFLPVMIEGESETHYFYNVTDCGAYEDPIQSVWECRVDDPEKLHNPTKSRLKAPAFDPSQLRKRTIFKIPKKPAIYCVERTTKASDKEFKASVEHHKLTGLRFRLAWSESTGPVPMELPPLKNSRFVWKTGEGKDYPAK
jgi:hypothetical protein